MEEKNHEENHGYELMHSNAVLVSADETHQKCLKDRKYQRQRIQEAYLRFLITGNLSQPTDSCQVQNILIARLVKNAVPSPP